MNNVGFTAPLLPEYDISKYILLGKLRLYQNDGDYINDNYIKLSIYTLDKFYYKTELYIGCSNSSDAYVAYYIGEALMPVILNIEGEYLCIYTRARALTSKPICVSIDECFNKNMFIPSFGEKPDYDESNLSNRLDIEYISRTPAKLNQFDDSLLVVQSTKNYTDYNVTLNANNADVREISPDTSLYTVWFVSYTRGRGSMNNYALQTWECVNSGKYHKYVREKSDITTWGDFIQVN